MPVTRRSAVAPETASGDRSGSSTRRTPSSTAASSTSPSVADASATSSNSNSPASPASSAKRCPTNNNSDAALLGFFVFGVLVGLGVAFASLYMLDALALEDPPVCTCGGANPPPVRIPRPAVAPTPTPFTTRDRDHHPPATAAGASPSQPTAATTGSNPQQQQQRQLRGVSASVRIVDVDSNAAPGAPRQDLKPELPPLVPNDLSAVQMPGPDWIGWQHKLRANRFNLFLAFLQAQIVPPLTPMGFQKVPIPTDVYAELRHAYETRQREMRIDEPVNIIAFVEGKRPTLLPNDKLNNDIMARLRPLHEQWANVDLVPSVAFGLRTYYNGSILRPHVDKVESHLVSSILHFGDSLDAPWPLVILDHEYKEHAVNLEPGEMVFYESARAMHSRPTPMNGTYYVSLFLHYRPAKGWKLRFSDVEDLLPEDWDRDTIEVDHTQPVHVQMADVRARLGSLPIDYAMYETP